MAKQIVMHILEQLKKGYQYKKIGIEISQKSSNSIDGLYVGAKIKYNAKPTFHSIN